MRLENSYRPLAFCALLGFFCLMLPLTASGQKQMNLSEFWDAIDDIRDAYEDMLSDCRSEGKSGDIPKYLKCLNEEWEDEVASEFKSLKKDYGDAMKQLAIPKMSKGYLGAHMVVLSSGAAKLNGVTRGLARITGIEPGGPAAAAGFKMGDIILSVGGKEAPKSKAVRRAIFDAGQDKKLEFKVQRDGKALALTATLGRVPWEWVTSLVSTGVISVKKSIALQKIVNSRRWRSVKSTQYVGQVCGGQVLAEGRNHLRKYNKGGKRGQLYYQIMSGYVDSVLFYTSDTCDPDEIQARIKKSESASSDSICSDGGCDWSPWTLIRGKEAIKAGNADPVRVEGLKLFTGKSESLRLVLPSCESNYSITQVDGKAAAKAAAQAMARKAGLARCNKIRSRYSRQRCVRSLSRKKSAKKSNNAMSYTVYGPCHRQAMNALNPAMDALMKGGGLESLSNAQLKTLSKVISGIDDSKFEAGEKALSEYLVKVYNARFEQILMATPDVFRLTPEARADYIAKRLVNEDRLRLADFKLLAVAADKLREQRVIDKAAIACSVEWEADAKARLASMAYCRKACVGHKAPATRKSAGGGAGNYSQCLSKCASGSKGYPSAVKGLLFTYGAKGMRESLSKADFLSSCKALSSEFQSRCVSQCSEMVSVESKRRWSTVEGYITAGAKGAAQSVLLPGFFCGDSVSGCQLCKRDTASEHKSAKAYNKQLKSIEKMKGKIDGLEDKRNRADTSVKEAGVGVKIAQHDLKIAKAENKADKTRSKIPLECNLNWLVPEELGSGSELLSKTRSELKGSYDDKLDAFKEVYQSVEKASVAGQKKSRLETAKDNVKSAKADLKQAQKDARESKKADARAKRQKRKNARACMKMCTAWGPCSNNNRFLCGRRCGHHRICPCCRSSRKWCKRQCY